MQYTQLYSKFGDMNKDLVKKISILLQESPLSDSEIALKAEVSREMVYKWRNRKVKAIRKSNLHLVSKVLGYKVVCMDNTIDLVPLESILKQENAELSQTMTEQIIKTQNSQIQDLLTDKAYLKETISSLKDENIDLKTRLQQISKN